MRDVVERLRLGVRFREAALSKPEAIKEMYVGEVSTTSKLFAEAADEIERLRARVRELKAERARSWYDFCVTENAARP